MPGRVTPKVIAGDRRSHDATDREHADPDATQRLTVFVRSRQLDRGRSDRLAAIRGKRRSFVVDLDRSCRRLAVACDAAFLTRIVRRQLDRIFHDPLRRDVRLPPKRLVVLTSQSLVDVLHDVRLHGIGRRDRVEYLRLGIEPHRDPVPIDRLPRRPLRAGIALINDDLPRGTDRLARSLQPRNLDPIDLSHDLVLRDIGIIVPTRARGCDGLSRRTTFSQSASARSSRRRSR